MLSRADPDVITPFSLAFGEGTVELSATSGAPQQFHSSRDPERRYLLDVHAGWHSVEHEWGSGHVVTSAGAGRWNAPANIRTTIDVVETEYDAVGGLTLRVRRQVRGERFVEVYEFRNTSERPLQVRALGVQTPFGDLYQNAATALQTAVHAHVFTGGASAWVAAQPMSGAGPVLGLVLQQGSLASYSLESRNANTLSNARGHLVLNITDAASNPTAFGGQRTVAIAPGEVLVLEWALAWYDGIDAFIAATPTDAIFGRLASPVGESIRVRSASSTDTLPDLIARNAEITREGRDQLVSSREHGVVDVQAGRTRTRVLFHLSVEELVRRRVRYILDRQRSRERPGLLAHAFVPIDTETGLTSSSNGWSDWTDGSERIAMPILLQLAAERGWADPSEVGTAIDGWLAFAQQFLLDQDLTPRRGSQDPVSRLYDSPWLVDVFLNRFRARGERSDLLTAVRILDRADELGAGSHLAIGRSRTVMAVAEELELVGAGSTADRLRRGIVTTADHFLRLRDALPEHEVAYEQAIVAPLIEALIDAHRVTGEARFLEAIRQRLPWLLAFGGPQPDVRTYGVALRHWDGYWFGRSRLFGDVFPHYWSALTSVVLLRLPVELRTEKLERLARDVLVANLANYRTDGSATCAFIMPSTIDGRPAHSEDPLANDQDWHLALWLDLSRREGVDLA